VRPAKRALVEVALGIAVIVLGVLVVIDPRDPHERLLAIAAIVGGVVIILNALPTDT
jgi:energy-converting hydrogenase Eha subunit C